MDKEFSTKKTKTPLLREGKWSLDQYLHHHFSALRLGLKNILLTPITSIVTIIALGVSLTLPIVCFLLYQNMLSLTHGWDKGTSLTIYLNKNVSNPQALALKARLEQIPEVSKVSYQTPQEALNEFKQLSKLGNVVDTLPHNPIPGVITVHPIASINAAPFLENLRTDLLKQSEVHQIDVDVDWVQKLQAILKLGSALTIVIACLVGLGVILVVGNTIRLALERHRSEIEVLSLIGATRSYIARPFLYRGFIYGVLGAFLAYLIALLSIYYLKPVVESLALLYQKSYSLDSLNGYALLILFIASGLLGIIGAKIAVLSKWQPTA